jgi:HNH endonuclease
VIACSLYFMTMNLAGELRLAFSEESTRTDEGAHNILDFLRLFGKVVDGKLSIDEVQSATFELKSGLRAFIDVRGSAVPQLRQFNQIVQGLSHNEFFLLLPGRPASTADQLECERFLAGLNNSSNISSDQREDETFGALLSHYDMRSPRTDRQTVIGNKRRQDRRCRFCGRSTNEGAKFDSVAHAIPAALGNRYLKLADECDECNGHFGREVEPHLIRFLDLQRVFLGTQGRGKNDGRPVLEFANGRLFHDGSRVVVESTKVTEDSSNGIISAELGAGMRIVPINCYRALVKIALSTVSADQLPFLHRTIQWVRYGCHGDTVLPAVATAAVMLPPNPSGQITLYVRRAEQSRLPRS